MKYDANRLSWAVRLALTAGVFGIAGAAQAADAPVTVAAQADAPVTEGSAADQTSPPTPTALQTRNLKGIVVTGSLIRRVDLETASPVVTLDRATLTAAGTPTLGYVLQQLPSVSGVATNPANNSNGGGVASPSLEGGDGASRVSLRGLGVKRTLVLVDGQRLINADLNMIPQSMIERVDVLAEGASTVYGSDAVGGVVNFILRKHFTGVEADVNSGISSHGDGQRYAAQLTAGKDGENYNIVGGLGYNKYDAILAPARAFSAHALYLSSGLVSQSGSGSVPNGRIQIPASLNGNYGCPVATNGTIRVTRSQGDGSSLADYRCYVGNQDAYNYATYNYIQTEQKRYNAFVLGSYNINENVTAFIDAFYNRTNSAGQDAPIPQGVSTVVNILASNPINPFGVTFSQNVLPGQPNSGYAFNTRLTGAGSRLHTFDTNTTQVNAGLRGNFGQNSWVWDASINYGHTYRHQVNFNETIASAINTAIANGANIFNQADPAATAALRAGVANPYYTYTQTLKEAKADASGDLFEMPAGTVQLSVGGLYRWESMNYVVSPNAVLDVNTLECVVSGEACGSDGRGNDSVKEAYAEALIPLLSDQPWAHSLNLDVGTRISNYSTAGTTTNNKIAIEWRPITELLVRGTISQVFRAPSLNDLYDGPSVLEPTLNDPCIGLSAAVLAQHSNACQFVAPNWGGSGAPQLSALYQGAATLGQKLKPEQGKSVDLGLVYDPDWLPGVSSSVDFWHVYLYDTLVPISGITVVNSCFNNNNSPYCSFITRQGYDTKQPGSIFVVRAPAVNLGNLSTTGIDYTLRYKIPHFNLGSFNPGDFRAGLATTYTATYKNSATPGEIGASVIDYAGTFSQQFGNIARWRGSLTFNWTLGNWSAQWQTRYINRLTALNSDAVTGANSPMASVLYHSIQVGYDVPSLHTRLDVGVDNISDKQPPLIYQNGSNYNVDTATYDAIGRYYWARATIKF
ncbi:MAG: TonB-dependent receptor [Rhodanobacter sp.]